MLHGGGCDSIATNGTLQGKPAFVEVYYEEKNTWSVVEQKHIPPGSPNAVEIEGRIFFITNKFPVDSGIRLNCTRRAVSCSDLGEWENLGKIVTTAVLCYLLVKRESLKSE